MIPTCTMCERLPCHKNTSTTPTTTLGLCEEHSSSCETENTDFNSHFTSHSALSCKEQDNLRAARADISSSAHLRKANLLKSSQRRMQRLEQKLRKIQRQVASATNQATSKFQEIDEILSKMLATSAVPSSSSVPFISSLISLKQQGFELTEASLKNLLRVHGLHSPAARVVNSKVHFDKSVCIIDETLQVLTASLSEHTLSSPLITTYSRCLSVSPTQILLTGGLFSTIEESRSASLVSLDTNTIAPVLPMLTGRGFHSMAWLDNKPAVIGGYSVTSLASVETFEHGRWTSGTYLNRPRHDHASCNTRDATYVVGGKHSGAGEAVTIERYREKNWEEITFKLPFDLHDFREDLGVIGVGEGKLLVLGGWEDQVEVVQVNVDSGKLKPLPSPGGVSKFPWNMWVLRERSVLGLTDEGAVIEVFFK